MKIAMVPGVYNKQGGIARYVAEVSERLSREHEVHVYAVEWRDVGSSDVIFHKVPGILSSLLLEQLTFTPLSFLKIKIDRSEYDVINGQSSLSLVQDVVTMQSCHSAWVKQLNKERNRYFRPTDLVRLIEKFNIERNCKKIIAISNIVKEEILNNYSVSSDKIEVIHSGVNLDEFNPERLPALKKETRLALGLSDDDFVISFAGMEFDRKGLKPLINAISMLDKDIKLIVVGNDNPLPYIQMAKKSGVEKNIHFVGHQARINKYYAASDVFVFPTRYEPYGLVIIEAMASGIPVVTSKIAGAAEIMTDGYDGMLLLNPENPNEIAEKIELLVRDEKLRENIGRGARKTSEKYSWDYVTERTLEVYEEVLKR